MKALFQPLYEIEAFTEVRQKIPKHRGILEISGASDSEKAQLSAGLGEECSRMLIVAENGQKAKRFFEDMRLYDPGVVYYPARDMIFYQAEISGNALTRARMQVIKALIEQPKLTVVTSVGGCMDYLLSFDTMKNSVLHLKNDSVLDVQAFSKELVRLGYERFGEVTMPGQFAIRGGIIDVFSLTEEQPYRIELWGDEIDSIRSFDQESQRSIENLEEISIYPATEEIGVEEETFYDHLTDTFLDYFDAGTPLILDEPHRMMEQAGAISQEFIDAMQHRLEAGKIKPGQTNRMLLPEALSARFHSRCTIALSLLSQRSRQLEIKGHHFVDVKPTASYQNQFGELLKDLAKWRKKGYRVILLSTSRTRGERLAKELANEGILAFYSENEERLLQNGEVMVTYGSASKGFEYREQKFILLSESDIFGQSQMRRKKKPKKKGDYIRSFSELSIGDYVIHESHGIGIYKGIEQVTVENTVKDYIRIEYEKGSSLFVPATQLELLQKFGSADRKKPKLSTLGGSEWKRTKSKVRSAVQNIAKELVELYALRQSEKGFAYGPDTVWQREFEELFPYEETADQLQAIEDTKKDMESDRIMDRLICGDVGFGKTEVAIRAAFKAVQENKQVVLLAPTTILAQQHYNTFVQRLKDFPVQIGLLCRFRTASEQKKTIADLKKGMVDILIGTHRVLSKDVSFKDLGLLIIDEEQRFGVAHKEKIKQMKASVDVISLTATPIPRTLHMGLVGIRDMSVLEEAPLDRVPVQTFVTEYDEEIIREAVSREMMRNGQVYYVSNRVNDIADVAARVAKLVPEARVAFAHGQMKERELEKIMYDFIEGEIDILVSTTIIETGLDIPNVNTIIIQGAERMGLSQLYQLRGRVGRSNRSAYAFFMYKKDRLLKEEAEKRLHAIREFTEVGSGVKIAMRDLEIRGAGNLLGAEQSGHMEAVGYDLYCKMLSSAIEAERGIEALPEFETSVDFAMDAFIPGRYISDEGQKLDVYKRIAAIETEEEAENMLDELMDRFGEVPVSVQNLMEIAVIKSAAHRSYVTEIKETRLQLQFFLYEEAKLSVAEIPKLLEKFNGRMQFKAASPPYFVYLKKNSREEAGRILHTVRFFLEELGKLKTG